MRLGRRTRAFVGFILIGLAVVAIFAAGGIWAVVRDHEVIGSLLGLIALGSLVSLVTQAFRLRRQLFIEGQVPRWLDPGHKFSHRV